jgi:hypothetical protein
MLDGHQAQLQSPAMEILDGSLPVAHFIVRGTGVDIRHAEAGCAIEQDRKLPWRWRSRPSPFLGGRRDGDRRRAGRLGLAHVDRGDPEQCERFGTDPSPS